MTLKAGLILAAVLLLFGGGFYFGHLHGKAQLEALQAAQFKTLADAYEKQKTDAAARQAALEKENAELTADRLAYPDVSVRVCHIAPVVSSPAKAGQVVPPGAGALPQVPAPAPDRDIGPELFQLADQADQIVANCRAQ